MGVLKKIIKIHKNNKLILKTQQRFRWEKHKTFTWEINETALNSYDDERIHLIDSIETHAYGTSKDLVCKKKETMYKNIRKKYKYV